MKQVWSRTVNDARLVVARDGDQYVGRCFSRNRETTEIRDRDLETIKSALMNEAGRLHPNYYGFEGARSRFLSFFEDGFTDRAYKHWERNYKERVMQTLVSDLPLEVAEEADSRIAKLARKAFGTNLLSSYENARIHEVLGSPHGPQYIRAAARFARATAGEQSALNAMAEAIAPYGRHSWPLLTYLPYFWRPDVHLFLKPEATRDFAERTGSSFANAYSSESDIEVYHELQKLGRDTTSQLRSLNAKDGIDTQSFIWVVGSYSDDEIARIAAWKRSNSGD